MVGGEWCPVCSEPIISVTRGIPSMGTCVNQHTTDRRDVLRRKPVIEDGYTARWKSARLEVSDAEVTNAELAQVYGDRMPIEVASVLLAEHSYIYSNRELREAINKAVQEKYPSDSST